MVKKVKSAKFKKINERKTKEELDLKNIEILKQNLIGKSNINSTIKKKKLKQKKIKKYNKKIHETKGNKNNNHLEELNLKNGGDLSPKKIKPKTNLSLENKKKESSQTLLQLIKNKQDLTEIQLNDGVNNIQKTRNSGKKIENLKKDLPDNKIQIKKDEKDDKNEYMKQLKSRIQIINGEMTLVKADVGLINKKYEEEHNQSNSPKKVTISNEGNVNSLSFLNIMHTKKWTKEETNLFYKALELFGLDFSFLEIVLQPRKRSEIKRKYLKEKKENPKEIEKAIYARKNIGKLNKVLDLYKTQKNQNNLGLIKVESFKKKNENLKEEKIDYNKEYKNILDN